MSNNVILKVGGSILTNKAVSGEIRPDMIKELAQVLRNHRGMPIILVHGAGSCGHPEALSYGIARGGARTRPEGVGITHSAVRRLNDAVIQGLSAAGVTSVGIHPLSCAIASAGRLLGVELRPISTLLSIGIIPVLHGDVVADLTDGATVISGDQLITYIARGMEIARIGVATDVPGVLHEGTVIPCITPATAENVQVGVSCHPDVTRGMEGKLHELLMLAEDGVPSEIFHYSRIGDFLEGLPTGGTRVGGVLS